MRRRINHKAKRTPTQWCHHFRTYILDPDGWRGADGKDFDERIDQFEFFIRWRNSTAQQGVKITTAYNWWRYPERRVKLSKSDIVQGLINIINFWSSR